MSEVVIATGGTEIIEALITDVNNAVLTGLTDIKIDCRRKSDGKLIDWNDFTFKSSGWTTRQLALTETDATNEAGWYRYSFNTGSIVSPVANDVYTVTVRQTSLTNASNVPQFGVIRTGSFVDTIAANLVTKTAYVTGTASAGAAQSITLAGLSSVDQFYRFCLVEITGGTGAGQSRVILNYVGSTKVATVAKSWATNPDSTSTFIVHPFAQPGILDAGIAQAGAATTITLLATSSSTNSVYVGLVVSIVGGTGIGQERVITAYVGSTQVATVDSAWATNPDSTSVYILTPTGRALTVSNLDKTGYSLANGSIALATFAAGAIDSTVLAANAIGASQIATDAITAAKIAAGAITSSEAPALANLDAAVTSRAAPGDAMTLADGAITAAKVASAALTTAKFAAGAIDSTVLAANAIGASQIATDAITSAKIAAGAITSSEAPALANLDVASSTLATAAALATAQTTLNTVSTGVSAVQGVGFTAGVDDLHSARTLQATLATTNNVTNAVTAINAHTDSNDTTIAGLIAAVQADTDNLQTRIPAALTNGRIPAYVGEMAADVVNASALASTAVTEIQNGLATRAVMSFDVEIATDVLGGEFIYFPYFKNGAAVVGASLTMQVSRTQGGGNFQTLDWDLEVFVAPADNTFPGIAMDPLDATYRPGVYYRFFDQAFPSNAVTPDIYTVWFYEGAELVGMGRLRVGMADTIKALPSTLTAIKGATFDSATDSLEALRNRGDAAWITATGFAVPGSAMTLAAEAIVAATFAADAISAAALSAAAVTKITTGLALEATLTAMKGAGFDTNTDSLEALRNRGDAAWVTATGFATPTNVTDATQASTAALTATIDARTVTVLAAITAVPAGVWAYTISGNATLTQAGGALYGLKVMSFNRMEEAAGNPGTLLVYADDGVTLRFSFTLRDATGGAVTASAGEPARRSAVA